MLRHVLREMHKPRYLKNLKTFDLQIMCPKRLWLCHFSLIDNINMQAFLSVLDILIELIEERSMIRT